MLQAERLDKSTGLSSIFFFLLLMKAFLHEIRRSIVNGGTGYAKLMTMVQRFILEGPRPYTMLCLTFTPHLNILTGTFLQASCSNRFQNLLWFVHGQGQQC